MESKIQDEIFVQVILVERQYLFYKLWKKYLQGPFSHFFGHQYVANLFQQ